MRTEYVRKKEIKEWLATRFNVTPDKIKYNVDMINDMLVVQIDDGKSESGLKLRFGL